MDLIYGKIHYLTKDDIEHPKLQIQDLEQLSPSLTLDNYQTYALFLLLRKDLTPEEVQHYTTIKDNLKKEDELINEANSKKLINKI